METVGKQVQVVSGLGVGGPVGGDLHHHHHPHPHGGHGHSLVGGSATPTRIQAQSHQGQPPPPSHNQHLPARSTPVQLHRRVDDRVCETKALWSWPRSLNLHLRFLETFSALL
ncbi:hypothetical protein KQX54_013635 [Cotesia glomerata]|uniref:Uncharacterized protein n=1 Tax=Cotesia glomerata TaxID=32391 RepID=A0AAV7IXZ5_COTGL|nr:hypothetical protein KQX54_013635 [Cotesia glomerata]